MTANKNHFVKGKRFFCLNFNFIVTFIDQHSDSWDLELQICLKTNKRQHLLIYLKVNFCGMTVPESEKKNTAKTLRTSSNM